MRFYDLIIIGGGPAGLAAAAAARAEGVTDLLLLERDAVLGGILNQCIHNGFGLHTFKEELTGPEYAARYMEQVESLGIPFRLNTTVLHLNADRTLTYINAEEGLVTVKAGAVILAMGCRERPRGALLIPGTRPAGIFSAGTAQKLVNLYGEAIGKEIVILGSGDIGLIMARRLTMEGAHVKAVAELLPYSGGLARNLVQCLDDYDIPLLLSHTVVEIKGRERVTGVVIAKVDENRRPIPGTETLYECDTLLLSCGLIPENELSREAGAAISPVTAGPVVTDDLQTSIEGVFACGNVLHVHDLVDYVSEEAANAGKQAAQYLQKQNAAPAGEAVPIVCEGGVRYTVPQALRPKAMPEKLTVRFRVQAPMKNRVLTLRDETGRVLLQQKKKHLAPGEMEQIVLKKEVLCAEGAPKRLTLSLEDET